MTSQNGLSAGVRVRLSLMMFLQFAIWGIWLFPMGTFLGKTALFNDTQIGDAYAMSAIGCIISPLLFGMIADRYVAAQKTLAFLNLAGGVFLYLCAVSAYKVTGGVVVPQPGLFKLLMLGHFLCFMPTLGLINHIAFQQLDNPGKQFPGIRLMGNLGWIAVGCISLFQGPISRALNFKGSIEETNVLMQCGAAIAITAGLFAFFLPNTPPAGATKKASIGQMLGSQAMGLFKDWNFAVFAFCSFLIMFAGIFYFTQGNAFLNEAGMKNVMFKQTYGQMCETIFMAFMPFFFARLGIKWMLAIGMAAWGLRYVCFAFGAVGMPLETLLYAGLLLHGPCYDFFFVGGQLYTDHKAPREIRASAQGLIYLITYGLGWFFASMLAGRIVNKYTIMQAGKVVSHAWRTIWLYPVGMAVGILVIFVLFFHDNARVGHEEAAAAPETAKPDKARV